MDDLSAWTAQVQAGMQRGAFDSAAHPRAPAGAAAGGQFVSADASKGEAGGGSASKDKQDQVKAVQKLLGLKQTGTFSAQDSAAVRKYQKAHGLVVDGIVGGQTVAALLGEGKRKPGPMTAADRAKLLEMVRGPTHHPAKKKTAAKKSTAAKTSNQQKHTVAAKPPARPAQKPAQQKQAASRALAHEKVGHTGKGLWGRKSWQLPAYIQHVANDLIQSGHTESRAIEMAVGIIKNWAAGHNGKGGHVSAETQAKAAAALAEWETLKAKAGGGRRMTEVLDRVEVPVYQRMAPLEDISIRAGGDGRTVTAYAAVFDTPTEIHDADGDYMEVIDRGAFNRAISDAAPAGGRTSWRMPVLFNHGMTIHGTPSERHSVPIGVPLEIKPDGRGLYTVVRYHKTPLADEVLEAIREGSIEGYSFSGQFRRSDPGGPRPFRGRRGALPTVRRMESTLREFGPATFPAYKDAGIQGVRAAELARLIQGMPFSERAELAALIRDGAAMDAPSFDASENGSELVAEDSPEDGRSDRSEGTSALEGTTAYHRHRLWQLRTEELCRKAGISLPRRSA